MLAVNARPRPAVSAAAPSSVRPAARRGRESDQVIG
jgi:hypothetical protein